jgi:hypothetical protein
VDGMRKKFKDLKKQMVFEVHAYSSELNKIYLNNKDISKQLKGFNFAGLKKDYKENIKMLRLFLKNRKVKKEKILKISYKNTAIEEANNVFNIGLSLQESFLQCSLKNSKKDIIKALNDYKKENSKIFSLIIGFSEDKKPIFKDFNNEIVILKYEII